KFNEEILDTNKCKQKVFIQIELLCWKLMNSRSVFVKSPEDYLNEELDIKHREMDVESRVKFKEDNELLNLFVSCDNCKEFKKSKLNLLVQATLSFIHFVCD
ncbi:34215_t:CDS:2, partial [Gigaspora margarita]